MLGGRFDINADWNVPHCDHRIGRGADLRISNLTQAQREYVRRKWDRIAGTNGILREADHWHVRTSQ